jgi:DNA-binding transcriptional ArsR family regulator
MTLAEPQLDQMFSALADPTRRAILSRLSTGEATVNELAEPFDLTVQAVSKHIKVLERCGLVSRSRVRQARPCRLEPAALEPAVEWIEQHRRIWNERFDQLDEHLRTLQQRPDDPTPR